MGRQGIYVLMGRGGFGCEEEERKEEEEEEEGRMGVVSARIGGWVGRGGEEEAV